jgi:hypothetical protein
MSTAAALKCIIKQLRQKQQFLHIGQALHLSQHDPLNKVHVTRTATVVNPATGICSDIPQVKVIDTRAALEAAILARNKLHFAQAEGTPFTMASLKSLTADTFLELFDVDGKHLHRPQGTFTETITVLEILHAAFQDPIPCIYSTVSFEDFVSALLHWKEATATSSSGHHPRPVQKPRHSTLR